MVDPPVAALLQPLLEGRVKGAAAFDADGTLWSGDVGEELLVHLHPESWAEYERRVAVDPADAFAYCAGALAGRAESELLDECRRFFARRFADRVFPFARRVVDGLHRAGVEVWIVSGSPRWPVVAGAEALGIPAARVLGVETRVVDGRVTRELAGPVPYLEGKVAALATRGVKPILAVGNSTFDIPMLAAAPRAFVVAPHGHEGELVRVARERAWPVQRA